MIVRPAMLPCALLLVACAFVEADAAPPPRIAVFGFSLDNTSPADSTKEELARTERMGRDFAADLQKSTLYDVVDTTEAAKSLALQPDVWKCNGCERPVAAKLGATLAAYGWIQKVSNLILNLNIVIEDVKTGRQVGGGSVDIRGNTDESWDHGLKFLLEEHVFPQKD